MTAEMMWDRITLEDMIAIGRDTVRKINALTMRDGAVASAYAAHAIGKVMADHPAIAERITAEYTAKHAAAMAAPLSDGAMRALELRD